MAPARQRASTRPRPPCGKHSSVSFGSTATKWCRAAPLVPANDPTLMFANAGMVQFKDVFIGSREARLQARHDQPEVHSHQRQAQRSRSGRPFAATPHVLRDARQLQLRGLLQGTGHRVRLGLFDQDELELAPTERLVCTYFKGEQRHPRGHRGAAISGASVTGFGDERMRGFGMTDNFWQMGDTGPCGPCSEIYYCVGAERGPRSPSAQEQTVEGNGWMEIWNLVFMQFERRRTARRVHARPIARAEHRHRRRPGAPGLRGPGHDQQLRHGRLARSWSSRARELSGKRYGGTHAPRRREHARDRGPRSHDCVPDRARA